MLFCLLQKIITGTYERALHQYLPLTESEQGGQLGKESRSCAFRDHFLKLGIRRKKWQTEEFGTGYEPSHDVKLGVYSQVFCSSYASGVGLVVSKADAGSIWAIWAKYVLRSEEQ